MAMPSSSSEAVGRELAHDLALVDDEDAVGQRAHLLELQRDEQDAAARVALGDQAAVDELDRPDVEAARGLRGDEHARVAGDLAGDDALLLVAARQRRGQRSGPPPRTSYSLIRLAARSRMRVDQQPAAPRQLGRVVLAQGEVLRQREVEDEAAALAVLGDVRDAVADHAARAGVGHVVAADDDRARIDRPQAGDRLDELALAVAVDAGQGDDLARAHGQRGAADRGQAAVVAHLEVARPRAPAPSAPPAASRRAAAPRGPPSAGPATPRSRPRWARCRSACRAAGR